MNLSTTKTQAEAVMDTLYGENTWSGFIPTLPKADNVQGWNGNHPSFRKLLGEAPNHIFVDVGVWKGQSTIYVANIIRELGLDGCVISVDTFLGSSEHWSSNVTLFERKFGMPDLFSQFLNNVFNAGLSDIVIPMPQTSTTAAQILQKGGVRPGIVHIDASHDYEDVLLDANAYWPLVAPGGVLVGDDYHETWPGVVRAANEFARNKGLELTVNFPKWIVRKPA